MKAMKSLNMQGFSERSGRKPYGTVSKRDISR